MTHSRFFCKWGAALIAAALLLPSCASSNTHSDTTDSAVTTPDPQVSSTPETELTDGLPDIDMDGFFLTFLNYGETASYNWSLKEVDVDEYQGVAVNDAIYERNLALEERFKASIQEKRVDWCENSIKTDVQAGATDYQVAMINDQKIMNVLTSNVLQMWNNMPGVRLEEKWWNSDANNVFQINGQQYAAVGDFNLSEYSKSYLIFFNKELYATRNSVDDLYQTVLDGNWTYDLYLQLGEEYSVDLNGDGMFTGDKDQFGLGGVSRVIFQGILSGANMRYIETSEEDNSPYLSVADNEAFIDYAQKIASDFGRTSTWLGNEEKDESGIYLPAFAESRIVFYARTMWDTEKFRNYPIEIGMLPSPKINEDQDKYYSITVGGVVSALPKTMAESDKEFTGILMEAMAFASRRDTLPIYKNVVLQGKYSQDKQSSEIIDLIFDGQIYDLGVTVWDFRTNFCNQVLGKSSTDIISYITSVRNSTNRQIEDAIKAVQDE